MRGPQSVRSRCPEAIMRTKIFGLLVSALAASTSCSDSASTPEGARGPRPASAPLALAEIPIEGLPRLGRDGERPLVTMVAFVDYECPYCAKSDATIAALRETYGSDLGVVVANKPLPMHEHAREAALAALAAAEQG